MNNNNINYKLEPRLQVSKKIINWLFVFFLLPKGEVDTVPDDDSVVHWKGVSGESTDVPVPDGNRVSQSGSQTDVLAARNPPLPTSFRPVIHLLLNTRGKICMGKAWTKRFTLFSGFETVWLRLWLESAQKQVLNFWGKNMEHGEVRTRDLLVESKWTQRISIALLTDAEDILRHEECLSRNKQNAQKLKLSKLFYHLKKNNYCNKTSIFSQNFFQITKRSPRQLKNSTKNF